MDLGQHTRSYYVGHGKTSFPFGSIHKVERCRTWHDIITLGQHIWSDDIGNGMLSSPFDSTLDWTTSGRANVIISLGEHTRSDDVSLGKLHDRTTSGAACYHLPWKVCTIG